MSKKRSKQGRNLKSKTAAPSKSANTKASTKTAKATMPAIDMPKFQAGFWKQHWWKGLLLLILPFALYWQSMSFGYVLDDQIVITDNSFTKQGFAGIDDLLSTESFTGYFGEQKNLVQGNRYRPLSFITFAIEYGINDGLNPAMSHFINILLYGLSCLLIFRLMQFLFRQYDNKQWWLSLPLLIAVLYCVHPIHTEAVANIKGRDEIMAMLLSLATLYYSLRTVVTQAAGKSSTRYMIMGMLIFFLALLSKENSITFLAIIPLTIYFFTPTSLMGSLKKVLPYVGVTAAYLALRFSAAGVPQFGQEITDLMNNPFVDMSGGEKLATISFTLLKYIQLYIFPHPLNHDYYPYEIPKLGWTSWQALLSLAVYLGLLVWAIRGWGRKTITSYGLFFYFITLSIASNVVINLGTFMNERFIFMASLGLTIVTTYLLTEKLGKWNLPFGKYLATALIGILAIGYTYKTLDRVPDWESAMTLNTSAVENGSNSARANSFMATAIYEETRNMNPSPERSAMLQDAYKYSLRAVEIHPKYSNANLMLAGVAAELYKKHRDQTRLLKDFSAVANHRPDTGFLTEYADYLEGSSSNQQELTEWYVSVGLNTLSRTTIHPKWAAHWLLRAYNNGVRTKPVVKGLAEAYTRVGDNQRAQRFFNELSKMQ